MNTILLCYEEDVWVAHLLEYDLVGQGKTKAAAVHSVLASFEWYRANEDLRCATQAPDFLMKKAEGAVEVAWDDIMGESVSLPSPSVRAQTRVRSAEYSCPHPA